MRRIFAFCCLLMGCQKVFDVEKVEAIPVFAPFIYPFAVDPRGGDDDPSCERPFGFDLDFGLRVAEAVYLGATEGARNTGARGEQIVGDPAFSAETLFGMRDAELRQWEKLVGSAGKRHAPRTPDPANKGTLPYSLGDLVYLPQVPAFASNARLGDTTYRWHNDPTFRIERSDALTIYTGGVLVLRTETLLLMAKGCQGFSCVEIDWVELGNEPFAEHMKFDEGGGASERRTFKGGSHRVQQRVYRRGRDGLACVSDMIERDALGSLLKPWDNPQTSPDVHFAADVFAKPFGIGQEGTLEGTDRIPEAGATRVLNWRARTGLDLESTVAMGFSSNADGTVRHVGLVVRDTDRASAVVYSGTEVTALSLR